MDLLRGFPRLKLLSLLGLCIMLLGYIIRIKISKKQNKHDNTEIVSKKTSQELWIANIMVLIGGITELVISIILFYLVK